MGEVATAISFRQALLFWLKLGCISFGGPAGQIAIMHQELVQNRRWISEKRFLHALNYCMLLPGPEAQQLATYIGWLFHRTLGGLTAGILFVLPSVLILIMLSWAYMAFGHTTLVAGLFYGLKPAVTALILQAVYRIGSRALKNYALWAIAAMALIALFYKVPFPIIILIALASGFMGSRLAPHLFASGGTVHAAPPTPPAAAMIDDDTRLPHTNFRWRWACLVTIVCLLLYLVPMGLVYLNFGPQHTYTQMGWLFTKAAFLTFGGAYAVLPYIFQGAVANFGWLSPAQMMDGLALGETTPGPLIMVVAFVAFVTGYQGALLGAENLLLAGIMAALLVVWVTFLPSFFFIFLGGPLVEATHDNLSLTAPLAAITAAVVGVILNLGILFAGHTFWPQGMDQPFDFLALGLTLLALFALLRFPGKVIPILAVCALAGLICKTITL